MTNGHDNYEQDSVIDRVDNPVIADPETMGFSSTKLARGGWAWIFCKQRNCTMEARLHRSVNRSQFPQRRRTKFNLVIAHNQPRSALT
jgi:hypothetical protein